MPFFLKVKYKLDPSVYQYQILIQSKCDMSNERQADKYGGFAGQLSLIFFLAKYQLHCSSRREDLNFTLYGTTIYLFQQSKN